MNKFELSIDHPMLKAAKAGFDACLKAMVAKAIHTGSMEGTAKLAIGFEIREEVDENSGLIKDKPEIKFKAGYSVPIKYGCDGKITEDSQLLKRDKGGYILLNGQISIDELLDETDEADGEEGQE